MFFGYIPIEYDPPMLRYGPPGPQTIERPLPNVTADTVSANDVLYDTTVTTTTTAADTRNAQELQGRIKAGGGVVKTNANSSDYIVAVNNRLKFSVTRAVDGSYEIRESNYFWLVVGAAALVGLAVIAKK